jgi:hypothetical protein
MIFPMKDKEARDNINNLRDKIWDERNERSKQITEIMHRISLLADAAGLEFYEERTDKRPFQGTKIRAVAPRAN